MSDNIIVTANVSTALDLIKGMEDLELGNTNTPNAKQLVAMHNVKNGNPSSRTFEEIIEIEGNESIIGTLTEWTALGVAGIKNLFTDKEKRELEAIEKEVKGGVSAFKEQTLSAAKTKLAKLRTNFIAAGKAKGEYFLEAAKAAGKTPDEFLKWGNEEIGNTINDLGNKEKADEIIKRISKGTENAAIRIASHVGRVDKAIKAMNNIKDDKGATFIFQDMGVKISIIEDLRNDAIALKEAMEDVAKNSGSLLSVTRSKLFDKVVNFNDSVLKVSNDIMDYLVKSANEISKNKKPDGTVVINGDVRKEKDIQLYLFFMYLMVKDIRDPASALINDTWNQMSKAAWYATGLPKDVADKLFK